MTFDAMRAELEPLGRCGDTGGYRRFAWTRTDSALREWFTGQARQRRLDVGTDRAGNLWASTADPDIHGPGLVPGSHLDSVPDGSAFDGPLGVVSAFAALDALGDDRPARPLGTLATIGRLRVQPNGLNVIASSVTAWLDARGTDTGDLRAVVAEVASAAGVEEHEESWTPATAFRPALRDRLAGALGVPVPASGAGHDAGHDAGVAALTQVIRELA